MNKDNTIDTPANECDLMQWVECTGCGEILVDDEDCEKCKPLRRIKMIKDLTEFLILHYLKDDLDKMTNDEANETVDRIRKELDSSDSLLGISVEADKLSQKIKQANIQLKPCPFCGGSVKIIHKVKLGDWVFIRCNDCKISTGDNQSQSILLNKWNSRVDTIPKEAEAKELPLEDDRVCVVCGMNIQKSGRCNYCNLMNKCPRCNTRNIRIRRDSRLGDSIVCDGCRYDTIPYKFRDELVSQWNVWGDWNNG